jgi:hypothetical protein
MQLVNTNLNAFLIVEAQRRAADRSSRRLERTHRRGKRVSRPG